MSKKKIEQIAKHFAAMGASDPESWASSQVKEGIPQWARFIFLRQAWKGVVSEGDTAWMESLIADAESEPDAPGAGIGPALQRLRALGASPEDITEVVRVMQWQLLADFCYLLDDPGVVEYPSTDLPVVNWALVQVSEGGEIVAGIDGLHESVLEMDPTGREMRPGQP